MRIMQRSFPGIACALAVVLSATLVAPASAESSTQVENSKATGELQSIFVFDPEVSQIEQVGDAFFYPTGDISDDTLVVLPDSQGNFPGGMTAQSIRELVSSDGDNAAARIARAFDHETSSAIQPMNLTGYGFAALPYSTSPVMNGTVGYFGYEGMRMSYRFFVTAHSNQAANGYGRGFYRGYNGSDFGYWSQFYYVGYSTGDQTGSGTVPWGNVLAVKQFYARSMTAHMATGNWS